MVVITLVRAVAVIVSIVVVITVMSMVLGVRQGLHAHPVAVHKFTAVVAGQLPAVLRQ